MQRRAIIWVAVWVTMVLSACAKAERAAGSPMAEVAEQPSPASPDPRAQRAQAGGEPSPIARQIVRTAELGLEADAPRQVQSAAAALVEELGGYVVNSGATRGEDEELGPYVDMVLRVPSEHFTRALERLRSLGVRVSYERVKTQDVTEEFIDLKARLNSQRALEAQFLEILKQAKTVKDALEVHTQLAQVRADIEKLEGRRQFLENQVALATIELRVTPHHPLVGANPFGLGDTIKRAASDAIGVTAGIVRGSIRALGLLIPVVVILVLPLALLGRALL